MRTRKPVRTQWGQTQTGNAAQKKLVLLIVAIVVIIGGFWLFNAQQEPAPVEESVIEAPEPEPAPQVPDAVDNAPDIPAPPPKVEETEQAEPASELPPLAESDDFARNTLGELSEDSEFELWIQTENLLQKSAAVIDGLAKGNMLRKIIPMNAPEEDFQVVQQDDRIYLDESNYRRFDPMVDTLTGIPPQSLASAFQTLRPLLEQAYSGLGNPPDKMDNSLVAAIDLILATPEVSGPIALKRDSVLYQFADPELESLPDVQKQMIRLGPENRGQIKEYLSNVRAALLDSN